ncbi:hypothetical protein ACFRCX_30725 [Streptomyces sp. NPDC056652]|uniref:hypothetical protein n=1 Tax=Streptomyces sp. NPDC056652 TaxID=3345893 RepID=UPI0036824349
MAVRATGEVTQGNVSSVGAVRRIRALYALGHYQYQIAELSGLSRDFVSDLAAGQWAALSVDRDRAVRRAYDQLAMTVGTSWKTRRWAERKGWVPPLAWDDDAIDDPKAFPQTDAIAPTYTEGANVVDRFLMGESVILDAAGRRQAIQHLMEWTEMPLEQVAARMEMTGSAVQRTWERLKSESRKAGRTLRRRVYVSLQDKNMTRDEMESAA